MCSRAVTADREPTLPADASKRHSRGTLEQHGLRAERDQGIGGCLRTVRKSNEKWLLTNQMVRVHLG